MHGMALNERVSRIYSIETEMNQAADMRARAWAQVQLGRDYNAEQNLQIESIRHGPDVVAAQRLSTT